MAEKLDSLSVEALRAELVSRTTSKVPGPHPATSAYRAREARGDFKGVDSWDIVESLRSKQKVLYGDGDRMEIHEIADERIQRLADSVAAIFNVGDIVNKGDGTVSLPRTRMAESCLAGSAPLCGGEPFKDQPAGAICTAFLVEDDVVATAGPLP
ncbi:MAG: hypothetical protein GKR94_32540 [Gammaproteobacteria bacterium]|nr:hypothetical protein [Gammaproteobacteria bacterium]